MKVLVLNAGSSSLKFQIINANNGNELLKGVVERIGGLATIHVGPARIQKTIKTHHAALTYLLKHINKDDIDAVGHRVVHGGEEFDKPVRITPRILKKIESLSRLAPLHNPANVMGIKACKKLLPRVPQVAVFDTSFHQTIPKHAFLYGLPYNLYKELGIRKYGFHGTSHQYIVEQTKKILGKSRINIISCHLGNGSSITAIKQNKSIDTSMGFTPLDGLIMGTRSGQIGPGVITFLEQEKKLSAKETENLLNKKSGFLGIDGMSDMRDIHDAALKGNKKAQLAIDMLCYDIVKFIGSYYAVLGKLDALVFTGGLGEQAHYVRKQVASMLGHLGIKLDTKKNHANAQKISAPRTVPVLVVPTNEELMIAKSTKTALK